MMNKKQRSVFQLFILFAVAAMFYFSFRDLNRYLVYREDDTRPDADLYGQMIYQVQKSKMGEGYTLAYPNLPRAYLLDLEGRLLKSWNYRRLPALRGQSPALFHVEPLADGTQLVTFKDYGLLRVSWDNEQIWDVPGRFHHDALQAPDGTIYGLTRKPASFSAKGISGKALGDFVQVLSSDGKKLREYSLLKLMLPKIPKEALLASKQYAEEESFSEKAFKNDSPADVLHTNALERIAKDIPGVAKEGDFFLSFRSLNMVIITDPEFQEIKWFYRGEMDGQHDPMLSRKGTIFILDNGFGERRSRVIEIDPQSKKIIWSYGEGKGEFFFTSKRGGIQELSNGNIVVSLISGVIFEITRKGEVVWKAVSKEEKIGDTHYRTVRLAPDDPFLRKWQQNH